MPEPHAIEGGAASTIAVVQSKDSVATAADAQAVEDILGVFSRKVPPSTVTKCMGYEPGVWNDHCNGEDFEPIAQFLNNVAHDAAFLKTLPDVGVGLELRVYVEGYADGLPVHPGSHLERDIRAAYGQAVLSPGMHAETSNAMLACLRVIPVRDRVIGMFRSLVPGAPTTETGRCIESAEVGPDHRGVKVVLEVHYTNIPAEFVSDFRQGIRDHGGEVKP